MSELNDSKDGVVYSLNLDIESEEPNEEAEDELPMGGEGSDFGNSFS